MSCGVGRRLGLDLAYLWLWHRSVGTALIRPLAWEPPCAMGEALKSKKKKKKNKKMGNVRAECLFSTFGVVFVFFSYME